MSATSTGPAAPLRCLIVQLARLGDTLQTLMALRAAKQLYPQLEITLITRERFSHAAKRVPWIKEVVTLPTDDLLGPVLNETKTKREALSLLAQWIRPLCQHRWDMVVNWTYSEASGYLTGLLPGRVKLGYTCRKDGTASVPDGWSHFIQAVVQTQDEQNIHLTDILTTQLLTALQIHVGEPKDVGDAAVTSKAFFTLELTEREFMRDPSKKWIAIQLGASQEYKSWSTESWTKFTQLLMERHPDCCIVLLGGEEDAGKAASIRALHPTRITSLAGQTTFDLWANVIGRCQWLISGDTAAIHLASVLGTRVLNLSIGPVRWAETGPYGNGHYVISPLSRCAACSNPQTNALSQHSCRTEITPEAAYTTWAYASSEWAHRRQLGLESFAEQIGFQTELALTRVHRSKIRDTADGGGIVYEPLQQRPLQVRDWLSHVLGYVARAWYCGWVPDVGTELPRQVISAELIRELRALKEAAEVARKVCQQAKMTAIQLRDRSSRLRSQSIMNMSDRTALNDLSAKLNELEALIERTCRAAPLLGAFSKMARVLMHNLRGEHISELAQQTADTYQQINEGLELLDRWVRHTLEKSRPVAIHPALSASSLSAVIPLKEPTL